MPDIETAQLTDRFMRRIHAQLGARAGQFDNHKVGPSGGILLLTLADMAPVKMHALVNAMQRDKSQMTRAVQGLEAKGLIERRDDPDDARVSVLDLTPLGQKAVLCIQEAVAQVLAEILTPLSADEQETLRALLRRL
ncbi:MAG: winged helix-turn-helix transcriptional regulator [Rhizobiales bacterium]|nr:winged helix-turn-helix transcriptional regulator [Hyphomicrobiales bacterium]MBO6699279.1 winged helix-turn-helix transcriptional regulator [Hyphomicrobiales bacterium]MBO6736817.1 winged helix-turn-helix transcriptional regulator [Hyphomicrobiales bacterium]MBO6912109.1 winged helix-turn-helix transcriptional regulator [Hyphomicrobiales bacterium]MBO6954523.1 winged helix-turn-helix transcriptional regulator [Hyphomicrobiales bacterium]